MLTSLTLFVVFLLIAALINMSKISLAAFGENKLEEMEEEGDKSFIKFTKLSEDQETIFGTIELLSVLALTGTAISGYFLTSDLYYESMSSSKLELISSYSTEFNFLLSVFIVSLFIILFVILIPKVLAFRFTEIIGKGSIIPILFLSEIFRYPVLGLKGLGDFFVLPLKQRTSFYLSNPSEDEIRDIISEGVISGALDKTEQEIIENIFEFNDLRANEVMIPRTEMIAANIETPSKEVIKEVIKSGHTLVPVYRESFDNIIGVIHTKDFIRSFSEGRIPDLNKLIRPAYFVPESKLISEILKEMQKQGERLAVVTDEYGGTEGVITMEDILEEIVGEIKGIDEKELLHFTKLPDGSYYILGSMYLDDFNETFNVKLPESDNYNTVAGFVADKAGKILNPGESFNYEGLEFELMKKIRQKMVQFKVYSDTLEFLLIE